MDVIVEPTGGRHAQRTHSPEELSGIVNDSFRSDEGDEDEEHVVSEGVKEMEGGVRREWEMWEGGVRRKEDGRDEEKGISRRGSSALDRKYKADTRQVFISLHVVFKNSASSN